MVDHSSSDTDTQKDSPDIGTNRILEEVLESKLTDWAKLLRSVEAQGGAPPLVTVPWTARPVARTPRSLRRGDDFDVRGIAGGLCLQRHPGLLERLFGWASRLFDFLLAPVRALREKLDAMLLKWARTLGAAFAFLAIPFALVAIIGDLIALATGFVRSLPALIFRPIRLLREFISLPFRAISAMLSRVIRTALLGLVGKWIEVSTKVDTNQLKSELARRPWLRGLILGFLRKGRPDYPVLIDGDAVSQVLIATRNGLFGKRHFLVIVEGDPIEPRFARAMQTRLLAVLMPFYWIRTVHMFNTVDESHADLQKLVTDVTSVNAEVWN